MKEATAAHPTERRGLSHGRFPETERGRPISLLDTKNLAELELARRQA